MKRIGIGISLMAAIAFLAIGCSEERKTHSRGFHLPEGDVEIGKTTFADMQCVLCHTVSGVELPDRGLPSLPKIAIGGEVHRVHSYGELVTSIISPEHVVSPKYLAMLSKEERAKEDIDSPMPVFNEEMTVQQLIDLVAFLHSRYQLIEPESDPYFYVMP
ncbi:MAG: c-type cytochrome [Verrucomicrobiales bacterium]|nr:c-type cytochrome [Verrucomicrobiales bacterium]